MSIVKVDTIASKDGKNAVLVEHISNKEASKVAAAGLVPVDSFTKGAIITNVLQVLFNEADQKYYQWNGALPKTINPNSIPDTAGGISLSAWQLVDNRTAADTLSEVALSGSYQDLTDLPDFNVDITTNVIATPDTVNDIKGNHSATFPLTGDWIEFTKALTAVPTLLAGPGQTIKINTTTDTTFTWEVDLQIRMRFVRNGTTWEWRAN